MQTYLTEFYSIEIPRKLKDFVEDPPVELRKPLKYPEMVKVHCIAALHLYAVAREFNSIGIEAEESGEAIHARWNKLTSRFYGMRGGRRIRAPSSSWNGRRNHLPSIGSEIWPFPFQLHLHLQAICQAAVDCANVAGSRIIQTAAATKLSGTITPTMVCIY